jgi:hypothetical protein
MSSLRWRPAPFWLGWIAFSVVGCKSFFAPRGIPDDPLLLGKQPIESKGQVTPYQPLVHHEPMPPRQDAVSQMPPLDMTPEME